MTESVYRHLPDWRIKWSYRKAMRKYESNRNQGFVYIAQDYFEEARRLADEIDRRTQWLTCT